MTARHYDFPLGAEGERRKLDAHARVETHREETITRGRRALLRRLLDAGEATADDVRVAVELPDGINPVCLGAVPSPLARTGIIRRVGFAKTTRAAGHARPVTVWRLADRDAALGWLAAHPEPPVTVAETQGSQRSLFGGIVA